MRFFNTNYIFKAFPGSMVASSNSSLAFLCFDEEPSTYWKSTGQGTDGTSINVERTVNAYSIDSIFVKDTNINNITIQVDIGAGYVNLSSASSFTLTKSIAGDTYFYKLDNSIIITKLKVIGSNTIIANQEKIITEILAFKSIGRINDFADVVPKRERIQVISKLNTGKVDIINKGVQMSFKVKFKSHYKAADNTTIENILNSSNEMWIWINDGHEDVMVMKQEPYRFGDLYKVALQKSNSVHFSKNMFFSGIDFELDLIEVA